MIPANKKAEISSTEKLNVILDRMEDLKIQFIQETVDFTKNWYLDKLDEFIVGMPEFTSKLTDDQLLKMKAEAMKLSNLIDEDVENAVENLTWWHKDTNLRINDDIYRNLDHFFNEEYTAILGRIGEVLSKYGYLPRVEMNVFGFSCYKDSNNLYAYHFINPVSWSYGMKKRMDNYWEDYKFAIKLTD